MTAFDFELKSNTGRMYIEFKVGRSPEDKKAKMMQVWLMDQHPFWFDRGLVLVMPNSWEKELPVIEVTVTEEESPSKAGTHEKRGFVRSKRLAEVLDSWDEDYHPDFEGPFDVEPFEIQI